jgi:hypothetical protein
LCAQDHWKVTLAPAAQAAGELFAREGKFNYQPPETMRMNLKRNAVRTLLPVVVAIAIPGLLMACSERQPAPPATVTPAPAPAPAPTMTPPADTAPSTAATPVVPPQTATDVEDKKGTDTGMVGGASGTVASGGKPGSGTASGAGTGPAQSSGEQTENKK